MDLLVIGIGKGRLERPTIPFVCDILESGPEADWRCQLMFAREIEVWSGLAGSEGSGECWWTF